MSAEKRNFDKSASLWDQNQSRLKMTGEISEAISSRIPFNKEMKVMDFGCGTGLVTLYIAPLAGSVTGIDGSRGMLDVLEEKIAEQHIDNVSTSIIDTENISLTGMYDAVVTSMTMHHVDKIEPLVGKFYEILKPGGYLCIADLDEDGGMFHDDNTGVFHSGFSREYMEDLFAGFGFTNIVIDTAACVERNRNGRDVKLSIFLISGVKKENTEL
jgi:ubiquinone/menaquinone biosynthesis C-methylase UbiE